MTRSLNIVFAGTPDFAARHLAALVSQGEHNIIAVYTQPDRPAGRGKQLQASEVKALAMLCDIPVYQPISLKTPEAQAELAALKPDLMVVVAYGLLLPQAVLDIPRIGCINVHGSILPRWRGAAPIQRAIEAGDKETGVTIMHMDAGLDTGPMLLISRCAIADDETSASLYDKLAQLGPIALQKVLAEIANDTAQSEAQDDAQSTYAKKIDKAEAEINWQEPATTIAQRIRAFNPAPVAFTLLDGERLKLWQAQANGHAHATNETHTCQPGEIIRADKNGVVIAAGQGSVVVTQLQLPGGKALPVQDILNGHAARLAPGTLLGKR
jgi:methionyl-tRNA formyltransferase